MSDEFWSLATTTAFSVPTLANTRAAGLLHAFAVLCTMYVHSIGILLFPGRPT